MRAVVLDAPGPPEALRLRELPVPVPEPGWVLIEVKAFGLNRSELYTRRGQSPGVEFPRVLGIEAVGVVAAAPGGEFAPGQQVAAMMGGMGRAFDGGYAEYTCVPAEQVLAFESGLDWATIGAVPEMLQTANGSLTVGLDAQPGQSLLIRGGTSSVGLAAAVLAKRRGLTVLATTRREERFDVLRAAGVDHPLLDTGEVAEAVWNLVPGGVDLALELVGTDSMRDTLLATRIHGTVCFTGMLSNVWTVPDWYPMDYIPNGVRLTVYSGDASDLPADVLQGFLDDLESGRVTLPGVRAYPLDQIVDAHRVMEDNTVAGKLVVVP
ncbi:zinc-binding alcohol dehydrogenase family protein [Solirubrobacter phytolaccae]|uniref:Zinc-binding alcohol dehydrogenase family protein n=1 Tax=Solirubrobacter phytolaccae TaxID=1404360 RepID=A0A9X3NF50_9ACTN|nr:zinc-binding alcohol dehydrogenase family protein [Solirubrobacter phytolaccae]MDA0185383.1 zinc-binding alcohol dehydrogenase family protein [Solirubrobacter phytolaccae]